VGSFDITYNISVDQTAAACKQRSIFTLPFIDAQSLLLATALKNAVYAELLCQKYCATLQLRLREDVIAYTDVWRLHYFIPDD